MAKARMSGARRVVVVASAYRGASPLAGWVDVVARRCAAEIDELGGLRPREVRFDPETDPSPLWSSLSDGSAVAAVVLLGATARRAARVQAAAAAAGGPVVVTDHDASTITLVAAALTSLGDRCRRVGAARAVVAGADRLPGVGEQLVGASVGEVTLWNPEDAPGYTLSAVAAGADVLINLLEPPLTGGRALPGVPSARTEPVVLVPDPSGDVPLVLPGLVHTLGAFPAPPAGPGGHEAHHDVCRACVLELVMTTPSGRRLPTPGARLSARIADAVARSLPRGGHLSVAAAVSIPRPRETATPENYQGESP